MTSQPCWYILYPTLLPPMISQPCWSTLFPGLVPQMTWQPCWYIIHPAQRPSSVVVVVVHITHCNFVNLWRFALVFWKLYVLCVTVGIECMSSQVEWCSIPGPKGNLKMEDVRPSKPKGWIQGKTWPWFILFNYQWESSWLGSKTEITEDSGLWGSHRVGRKIVHQVRSPQVPLIFFLQRPLMDGGHQLESWWRWWAIPEVTLGRQRMMWRF